MKCLYSKTEKNTNILFILVGLTAILPFIVLSLFTQPVIDDFWYAKMTLDNGFFKAQYLWYMSMTARYFSTILISVNPLIFGCLSGVKVVPIVLLILFYWCCYLLVKELFVDSSKLSCLGISSLISFVFLSNMPDTGYGIYFLTTAITFFLPNILLMAFLYCLLKSYKVAAVLLGIAVVGGNEHSMLVILALTALANLIYYYRNRKVDGFLALLMGVLLAFAVFQLVSPGNRSRSHTYDKYNNKNVLFSLQSAVKSYLHYLSIWLPTIILTNLIFLKEFNTLRKDVKINLLLSSLSTLLIAVGTIFIIYWSVGTAYFPERSIITTYLFTIFASLFLVADIVNRFNFSEKIIQILKSIAFILLISSLILPSNRIRIAYGDWFWGRGYQYQQQFEKRYQYIKTCNLDTCIVEPLRFHPPTIFVSDIIDDYKDERNKVWAWYFKKKAIKTK